MMFLILFLVFLILMLILLQSIIGEIIYLYLAIPIVIILLIAIIKSIIYHKKNKKNILYANKNEQLYSIINNVGKYHKIVSDINNIDIVFISYFGIITINVLNIDGEIKLVDNKLYYKKRNGKEGYVVNFLDEINNEVDNIKNITNISNIEKYLIVGKEKVSNENFANGFHVLHINEIFFALEKIKENIYSEEEIDRMYELIKNGYNKN